MTIMVRWIRLASHERSYDDQVAFHGDIAPRWWWVSRWFGYRYTAGTDTSLEMGASLKETRLYGS